MRLPQTIMLCSLAFSLFAATASSAELKMDEATRLLKESKDAETLFSLSFYYEEAGRPFSALQAMESALAIEEQKPTLHARYGQLLLGRRRLQEAAAAYAKAAALAPEAKFFKATEARAFAECGRWPEAIAAWESLLASAADSREAMDAAANIERLAGQTRQPSVAERAWLAAMTKAQNTGERLQCASAAAEAMLRQGEASRSLEHWERLMARETDWSALLTCAQGITRAAQSALPEDRQDLLQREIAAWQGLYAKASASQRQECALFLANAYLRAKEPTKAIEALIPYLRTGKWDQDLRAIEALAGVYKAQGDSEALRNLWQKVLAEFHPLRLEAGRTYEIKLEYYERSGGAVIKLLWSGPQIAKQPVLPEFLIPADGDGKPGGLRAEYFGSISLVDTKLVRVDAGINFDWGVGAPAAEVPADNFSCRWTGKIKPPASGVYHFYTIADDGVRLWLDGRLIIDNWTDHAPTEDASSGYRERYPICRRLAACMDSVEEEAKIWQQACEMFPSEAQPRADLAEALLRQGKYDDAIAAYEQALKILAARPEASHQYDNFLQRLIAICCSRQRLEQATELLLRYAPAPNNENFWPIQQALYAIQNAGSVCSSMAAAIRLAEAGGWRRVAAAEYLCQTPYRDLARSYLRMAADDAAMPGQCRYRLFQLLVNLARHGAERVALMRQQLAFASDRWQKAWVFDMMARELAQEGLISEALGIVQEADSVRQNNWCAGPDVLSAVAQCLRQGRRVGPGLRTSEGIAKAESSAQELYGRWRDRGEYADSFAQLFAQLSQVRRQRGEPEAALAFLRRAAEVRAQKNLRLEIALLTADMAEAGKMPDAMPDFIAYAEAVAAEHSQEVARHNRRFLPSFDRRLSNLLERQKQQTDFEKEVYTRLAQRQAGERQALAESLLAYQKQQGRLEEMAALLKKIEEWGYKDNLYVQEAEWVRRGLAMKNAASRADAEQRQRLLQDLARWEEVCRANPEDYQALFNLAKCQALLGDETKARETVATVRQRWPKDPLVLEIYSRERMLDKGYAEAAQALAEAAEITGRRLDYEETICSAYEMAGRFDLAIGLALDALAAGQRAGRGFRTPEQIFDMAERSDNLAFLRQRLGERLQSKTTASLPSEGILQLAVRVAWHEGDESLADAALSGVISLAQRKGVFAAEAVLRQLAAQAEERQHLDHAIRLRQSIVDSAEARGQAPRLDDYEALARLLLRKGDAKATADLMFAGLRRAGEGEFSFQPPQEETPIAFRRRVEHGVVAPYQVVGDSKSQRTAWTRSIFNLVANEHAAGGQAFRQAAAERLQALVEEEIKTLAANPRVYAGPLLMTGLETALSLTERITSVFRAQCQKAEATADDHLALAERLAAVALMPRDEKAPQVQFAEIAAACSAALEKAESAAKPAIARSRCRLYRRLFTLSEDLRFPELTAETILQGYESAIALSPNLDLLQEAIQFAREQKKTDLHLAWARKRYQLAVGEASARADLVNALFAAGAVEEAINLLRQGLDQYASHSDYRAAAEACWQHAAAAGAALAAAEFCQQAVRLYEEAAGPQLDAKGNPLPDAELASLYNLLARAHAACGKPDEAWSDLLGFLARATAPAMEDPAIAAVAEAFAKAKRRADLLRLIESKVTTEPKAYQMRLLHANFLAGLGEWAAAADAMRAARALQPDLAIVKRLIAMLRQSGDLNMALAEAMAWAESLPRDAEAYRTMAEIYRDLKDEAGELRSLTMLVEIAPRDADNCRQVASIFLERGEPTRAVSLLERAVELRPEEPYRHIDLAEALFAAKEMERAETVCREALTRDWGKGLSPELLARMPNWRGTFEQRGHALLAEILEAQGKKDEASRERLQIPAGYKRPLFKDAIPSPRPQRQLSGRRGVLAMF